MLLFSSRTLGARVRMDGYGVMPEIWQCSGRDLLRPIGQATGTAVTEAEGAIWSRQGLRFPLLWNGQRMGVRRGQGLRIPALASLLVTTDLTAVRSPGRTLE